MLRIRPARRGPSSTDFAARTPASPVSPPPGTERGFALVVALLVLLVLSLLGIALMTSVNLNTKGSAHGVRQQQALSIAEAGVSEAVVRLQTGDIPDTLNPRIVAKIFLASAGSVPALGADSVALATAQPAGKWLNYSTATRGSDVLTVTYKTNAARTVIYRYDAAANPKIQTTSGNPIFVITSTGRDGADRRQIVTEVVRAGAQAPTLKGALMANVPAEASGGSAACGYNHSIDMPKGANCSLYHIGTGDITGGWGTNTVYTTGGGSYLGTPPMEANQTGFPAGPWELFGMTQSEFYTWVGPAKSSIPASPMTGPIYLDNNATKQDKSGTYSFIGGVGGSGFVYVDGSLKLLSGAWWTGLIYTEGNVELAAGSFTKGGVVCNGTTLARTSGSGTLVYSEAALKLIVGGTSSSFMTLSWRELD